MKRLVVAVAAIVIGMSIFFFMKKQTSEETPAPPVTSTPASVSLSEEIQWAQEALSNHGTDKISPVGDVEMIFRFVQGFALANRHIDAVHYTPNASLTEVLLGHHPASSPVLTSESNILGKNEHGETVLVDRWDTPYHVHVIHEKRIEFRSAGPDRVFGNEDDIIWPLK